MKAIDDFVISVPFRGPRTYITGATLLDTMIAKTGAEHEVWLAMSTLIKSSPVLVTRCESDTLPPGAYGRFVYKKGAQQETWALTPSASPDPELRIACNEKSIMELTTVDEKTRSAHIDFVRGEPGTLIETAVAVNKKFIEALYKPQSKLYYTQSTMDFLPGAGKLEMTMKRHLGTKLFVSRMAIDGQEFGEITFIAA